MKRRGLGSLGVSLLEMVVGMGISSILVLSTAYWFSTVHRSLANENARNRASAELSLLVADFRARFKNRNAFVPQLVANSLFVGPTGCGDVKFKQGLSGGLGTQVEYQYHTECVTAPSTLSFDPANYKLHPELNCAAGQIPVVQLLRDGVVFRTFPVDKAVIASSACFTRYATTPCPAASAPCPDFFNGRITNLYSYGKTGGLVSQTFSQTSFGRSGNILYLPPD